MKRICLIAGFIALVIVVSAQAPSMKSMQTDAQKQMAVDTAFKHGWKKGALLSVNFAQGSSSNWAAGAEKFSLAFVGSANVFANYLHDKWSWNNNLSLNYAVVSTTSLGVRKNDDRIDFFSRVGYALGPKFDLSGIVTFRSQFTNGYEYNYLNDNLQHRVSGFFAPAYITVAPGVTWKPTKYFNVFISPISARWVIVSNQPYSYYYQGGVSPTGQVETPLATSYGVDPGQKVKIEVGAFLSATFNKEIIKNVTYISRLDLYSNYLKDKRAGDSIGKSRPENVSLYWTNAIVMKVNKWLNVTYNLDLIYDDDIRQFGPNLNSAGLQVRSLLGVGFQAKF